MFETFFIDIKVKFISKKRDAIHELKKMLE